MTYVFLLLARTASTSGLWLMLFVPKAYEFFSTRRPSRFVGKDLYTHLDDVYQNAARYCVLFVSRDYARKVWTNHERESAQARQRFVNTPSTSFLPVLTRSKGTGGKSGGCALKAVRLTSGDLLLVLDKN